MTLDEGHYYITFCCHNLWKSKFMALEKLGKLGNFFYFVATLLNLKNKLSSAAGYRFAFVYL